MPPPGGGKVSPIRSEYAVTYRSGRTNHQLSVIAQRKTIRCCGGICGETNRAVRHFGDEPRDLQPPIGWCPEIAREMLAGYLQERFALRTLPRSDEVQRSTAVRKFVVDLPANRPGPGWKRRVG